MIKIEIENSLPELLSLKNRNRYLVEGWVVGASRVKEIRVRVGGRYFTSKNIGLHRPDVQAVHFPENRSFHAVFSGFSIPVILDPVQSREDSDISLECIFLDGSRLQREIGTVSVTPWQEAEYLPEIPPHIDQDNLLVICLATYNPSPGPFKRQIDSIIGQEYRNWICLICDDNSSKSCKAGLKAAIQDDPRFFLIENDSNVGFYRNFERCLELVPRSARYVALSDQDDIWYPDKLSKCLAAFNDRTMLVYCDMNIVDKDRNVLSATYWKNRKNYYRSEDIDLLTLANTVTGAASVFKRELLDLALPFPPRYGLVFHDQWLAILAAGNGGIEYVDRPLYEYVQYGDNVIGHSDFGRESYLEFVKNYFFRNRQGRNLILGLGERLWMSLKGIPNYGWYTFRARHSELKHVITLFETALLRRLDADATNRIRQIGTVRGLLRIHIKVHKNKETLNDLEYQLLFGMVSAILFKWATPLFSLYVGSRLEQRRLARVKPQSREPEC
jgi:glycosyltransferase involved in cell wall biosynthesis